MTGTDEAEVLQWTIDDDDGAGFRIRAGNGGERIHLRSSTNTTSNNSEHYLVSGVTLTDGVATTIATFPLTSDQDRIGGVVTFSVLCTDGVGDVQVRSGQVSFSIVNDAGTITGDINASGTDSAALTGGSTLPATFTLNTGDTTVELQCNANSNLTVSNLEIAFELVTFGQTNGTVTTQ